MIQYILLSHFQLDFQLFASESSSDPTRDSRLWTQQPVLNRNHIKPSRTYLIYKSRAFPSYFNKEWIF